MMNFWRKKSLIKLTTAFFLAGTLTFLTQEVVSFYFYYQEKLSERLIEYGKVIITVRDGDLNSASPKAVNSMMALLQERSIINFYQINDGESILFKDTGDASIAFRPLIEKSGSKEFEAMRLSSYPFGFEGKQYNLIFGQMKTSFWSVFFLTSKSVATALVAMLVFILAQIIAVTVVARKEFVALFRALQSLGTAKLSATDTHSEEAAGLKSFIHSAAELNSQLKLEKKNVLQNLDSAKAWGMDVIKDKELRFEASFIRVDMNHFTGHLAEFDSDEDRQAFKSYFIDWGKKICARYNAKVEKEIGDELVAFIEASPDWEHSVAALHLARTFFEEIHEVTEFAGALSEKATGISLKASLVSAPVILRKENGEVRIDSDALITSERLLKSITEKNISTLICFEDQWREFKNFMSAEENAPTPVLFKTSDNRPPRQAMMFTQINGLAQDPAGWPKDDLQYFRSQLDIISKLKLLGGFPAQADLCFAVISSLKNFDFRFDLKLASPLYLSALKSASHPESDAKFLSALVSLARGIYLYSPRSAEVIEPLRQLLRAANKRVVATARENIVSLDSSALDLMSFIQSNNNRAAADALVDYAKINGLDSVGFQILKKWCTGVDQQFRLSAFYAAATLNEYFFQQHPEYFSSNLYFSELSRLMQSYLHTASSSEKKWIEKYLTTNENSPSTKVA